MPSYSLCRKPLGSPKSGKRKLFLIADKKIRWGGNLIRYSFRVFSKGTLYQMNFNSHVVTKGLMITGKAIFSGLDTTKLKLCKGVPLLWCSVAMSSSNRPEMSGLDVKTEQHPKKKSATPFRTKKKWKVPKIRGLNKHNHLVLLGFILICSSPSWPQNPSCTGTKPLQHCLINQGFTYIIEYKNYDTVLTDGCLSPPPPSRVM